MDMRAWLTRLIDSKEKKPIPILSFPGVQLLGVTVEDLIADSGTQARALQAVADRCDGPHCGDLRALTASRAF